MKIYRFKNGDKCPCCGNVLTGKTPEELDEISVQIYGFASALGLADWILHPGEDAIEITPWDLRQRLGIGGDWDETCDPEYRDCHRMKE